MEYIDTAKAASTWNLSPARVRALAREGKIEGAKQVGRGWLIPATAEKPLDGRSRQSRRAEKEQTFRFRLPLYLLQQGRIEANPQDYSQEEHALYQAQLLVESCNVQQALKPLTALAQDCSNPYVRVGAIHDLCLCYMCLGNSSLFNYWVDQLHVAMLQEERYGNELKLVLLNLDACYKGNDGIRDLPDFNLDEAQDNGIWAYLASCASYVAMLDCLSGHNVAPPLAHELNCHTLEKEGCYFGAIRIHLNLAMVYQYGNDEERSRRHLRRAVELSYEHNLIASLATMAYYRGEAMDKMLSEYDNRFAQQIKGAGRKIRAGYRIISQTTSENSVFANISTVDFEYINLAIRGFTNKEIARMKGVSQVTVSKRFSAICSRLSLASKRELVEFTQKSLDRY